MAESSSLSELIDQLSLPRAYPHPVSAVEVKQTHISLVFLAGDSVYKVKKPVKLPFLDFSTLERRQHFCHEEVRLNRRLAGAVYKGVVPIKRTDQGLMIDGTGGDVVEWAVNMQRLPDAATFETRMVEERLDPDQVVELASRIADFHRSVPAVAVDAAGQGPGSASQVAQAIRDNLAQARLDQGRSITPNVFHRLHRATEAALRRDEALLTRRAGSGWIRDLHGDLHLDHIYLNECQAAPDHLVIVDCIEFNPAFRTIDVVADMAFCAMDFEFHGRSDLAATFCRAYFAASDDPEGHLLLPLYQAYRAGVRGKVEGILSREEEVGDTAREAALRRARAYWLLALGALETPTEKPALVLVSGLPGTGKSTVARALAEHEGFQWIRSDVVRKELAGAAGATDVPLGGTAANFQQGIYTPEWTERTYAECLTRTCTALEDGGRVVVDATFLEESRRCDFLQAAATRGVAAWWMVCTASPHRVRQRLRDRTGDVSDADESIYEQAATAWQPPSPATARRRLAIDANVEAPIMAHSARQILNSALRGEVVSTTAQVSRKDD